METLRQRIAGLLETREMTARDLSRALGIRETEVCRHLPSVARSLKAAGRRLEIMPFSCLHCKFVFKDRQRFTRPGHCPRCRSTHLESPLFRVRPPA